MLALALGACLATGCSLPLSHTCRTSDDCLAGVCMEGVCRESQTGAASQSEASAGDSGDAAGDRQDGSVNHPIDGDADSADAADATATDTGGDGNPTDRPTDSSDDVTDGGATDIEAPSPDSSGIEVHQGCGPSWAEWPMPAPATLTGVPDDPVRDLPNPASYDTTDPDVVVDNVTHLVWQRDVSTEARTYNQAVSYCASLDFAGRTDWRLPSRIELISLIDWDQQRLGDMDPAFPEPPFEGEWTCTPGPGNPLVAWMVDFTVGSPDIREKRMTLLARCVSGSRASTPPPARYQIGLDGTVTDIKTLLTWQASPSRTDLTFGQGFEYCQGLGPGWRLPTVLEIETLVDETLAEAAVDPSTFPDWPNGIFWTSSFFDHNTTLVWVGGISYGFTNWFATSTLQQVICVR
jgi:hypothetical protein